jgi:hypothetical protein
MESCYDTNGPWATARCEDSVGGTRHEADDITFDQLNFFFKNVYSFADSCKLRSITLNGVIDGWLPCCDIVLLSPPCCPSILRRETSILQVLKLLSSYQGPKSQTPLKLASCAVIKDTTLKPLPPRQLFSLLSTHKLPVTSNTLFKITTN